MEDYFDFIDEVKFKGPDADDYLAFSHYNPDEKVGNKKMSEHLRFSMAYWHTLTEDGTDPFGAATISRPWNEYEDPVDRAKARAEAAFEFMSKLNIEYFCFHDWDLVEPAQTLSETNRRLDSVVDFIEQKMQATGIELLWGTSNLFSHPVFMHGAATSSSPEVFALAGAKVKKAMEITKRLGGKNYVFWGGREGYETLLNVDLEREQENMARFFEMALEYKEKIGFEGQLLLEPKPKEPTKHQYDFDAGNCMAFLRRYNLEDEFKLNIEANHATLAGHTFQHELRFARINDMLGSVDANQGDLLLGWDTDHFPGDSHSAMLAMYEILKNDGIAPGGLNFDAKVRRSSFTEKDLFHGHILGMDTFARGLKAAHALLESGELENIIEKHYADYKRGLGAEIKSGSTGFRELEDHIKDVNIASIDINSGRQEKLRQVINRYLQNY